MKNLATCKPSEFIKQTNKIKKSAEKWLKITDIMEIRKRKPEIKETMTAEERRRAMDAQAKENLSAMLDEMLEKHPDETLELLALMCFVEPKDIDSHPVGEYIECVTELLNDKAVLGFFSSLMRLGQMTI